MRQAGYFLISLRPTQCLVKNVFIFAPMVFSLHLFQPSYIKNSLIAFLLFSLVTGSIYVFNDVIDKERDRQHPQKRHRPIAAGKLKEVPALTGALLLLAAALLMAFRFSTAFFNICLIYFAMTLLYSLVLKAVVIVDIMIIAIGFVLRVMAGGAVNRIYLSPWIFITTFLLAIFLALIKRRQELIEIKALNKAPTTRMTLKKYNVGLLDQMISIATATTLISYIMYVLSPETQQKFHTTQLYYTVPFVIFGIFRYLYLSFTKGEGENPAEIVFTDFPFTLNGILWLAVIIYLVNG